MIIGICTVCKGPVSDEEPLMLFKSNLYHVSRSACESMREQIAAIDSDFLGRLRISQ